MLSYALVFSIMHLYVFVFCFFLFFQFLIVSVSSCVIKFLNLVLIGQTKVHDTSMS